MENRKRLEELIRENIQNHRAQHEDHEDHEDPGSENETESTMIMEDISENGEENGGEILREQPFSQDEIIWEGLGLKITIKKIRHRRNYRLHLHDDLYEVSIDPVSEDQPPRLDIIFAANCGFRSSIDRVLDRMREHYTEPDPRIVFLTAIMIGLLNGKKKKH